MPRKPAVIWVYWGPVEKKQIAAIVEHDVNNAPGIDKTWNAVNEHVTSQEHFYILNNLQHVP